MGSYGRLSDDQRTMLRAFVRGRTVHDLGAGGCGLSVEIAGLGAERVVAVDAEPMPPVRDPRVEQVRASFADLRGLEIDVAFVSAPPNEPAPGLVGLLQAASVVVYVGKNTDGTACGWPGMFAALARREVLAYVPEPRNTLIIYGDVLAEPRKHVAGEEHAGLTSSASSDPLSFEEAESRAWPAPR